MTLFEQRYRLMEAWVERARASGWLSASDVSGFFAIDLQAAETLFTNQVRPLVIGLFGGTGVGKSTLLNRLAGEDIADVGTQRPTSRQVTMYLHESQGIDTLPQGSPSARTRVHHHQVRSRRDVAWLDMPDMDSVEIENREVLFAWLPYVDWLVYVVSPERYRDDPGWRILQQRAGRHHWLFVMNRGDESAPDQLQAFTADLEQAGFDQPRVLLTCGLADVDDEFDQLEQTINSAIEQHGLAELKRIGMLARLHELERLAADIDARFGRDQQWGGLIDNLRSGVDVRIRKLEQYLETKATAIARLYPPPPPWWRSNTSTTALPEPNLQQTVWDAHAQRLVADVANETAVRAAGAELLAEPVVATTEALMNSGKQDILECMNLELTRALASPGLPLQRFLVRAIRALTGIAPVCATGWVGYHVFRGYQLGLSGEQPFLGADFAVHSLLVIALAWLLPFLLSRWLRPSLQSTVKRGLTTGAVTAIRALRNDLIRSYAELTGQRTSLLGELRCLCSETPTAESSVAGDADRDPVGEPVG